MDGSPYSCGVGKRGTGRWFTVSQYLLMMMVTWSSDGTKGKLNRSELDGPWRLEDG